MVPPAHPPGSDGPTVAKFHISNQVFSLGSNSVRAERLCVCMLNSVTSVGELKMYIFVDNFMWTLYITKITLVCLGMDGKYLLLLPQLVSIQKEYDFLCTKSHIISIFHCYLVKLWVASDLFSQLAVCYLSMYIKVYFLNDVKLWLNILYSSAPSSVKTEVKLVCTPMQRIF